MGNEVSKPPAWRQIAKAIPPVTQIQMSCNSMHGAEDTGVQAFANSGDRDRFIDALLVVLSNNIAVDLANHDFKLLYSRRPKRPLAPGQKAPPPPVVADSSWFSQGQKPTPDDGTRVVATLVAFSPAGTMVTKIESQIDGRDVGEAFRALKRDVEERLDEVLQRVPSLLREGEASGAKRDVEQGGKPVVRDTGDLSPPAYPGDAKR